MKSVSNKLEFVLMAFYFTSLKNKIKIIFWLDFRIQHKEFIDDDRKKETFFVIFILICDINIEVKKRGLWNFHSNKSTNKNDKHKDQLRLNCFIKSKKKVENALSEIAWIEMNFFL